MGGDTSTRKERLMAEDQKYEAEQARNEARKKVEAEALAADPIGGKPSIDIVHEREAKEREPLGYVDPASQEQDILAFRSLNDGTADA